MGEPPTAPDGGLRLERLSANFRLPPAPHTAPASRTSATRPGGRVRDLLVAGEGEQPGVLHNLVREAEFWASPDFSRNTFGGFPDVLRSAEERFVDLYRSQLRPFEAEYEVAPGVFVRRTDGHTRGHSVVRLASGGDRLTFLGDAVFPNHFDRPDWYNAFDHDPEEAVRVRVRLLRELATTREPLVAAQLSFRLSAGWRSPATSFALYRPPGSADDLLG